MKAISQKLKEKSGELVIIILCVVGVLALFGLIGHNW